MAAPFSIDIKAFDSLKASGDITLEFEAIDLKFILTAENDQITPAQTSDETSADANCALSSEGWEANGGAHEWSGCDNHCPSNMTGCFAEGTRITTPNGETPIEKLGVGDVVKTLDHGPQPVRWVGVVQDQAARRVTPVTIKRGALGNRRDLCVSSDQCVLLASKRYALLFDDNEVLAPAAAMSSQSRAETGDSGGVFYQILFDNHEIIYAEGALTESLLPGGENALTRASDTMSKQSHQTPASVQKASPSSAARPVLRNHEARVALSEAGLAF